MNVDNIIKKSLVDQQKSKKAKLLHKKKQLDRINKTTKSSACKLEVSFFVPLIKTNFCKVVDTCSPCETQYCIKSLYNSQSTF